MGWDFFSSQINSYFIAKNRTSFCSNARPKNLVMLTLFEEVRSWLVLLVDFFTYKRCFEYSKNQVFRVPRNPITTWAACDKIWQDWPMWVESVSQGTTGGLTPWSGQVNGRSPRLETYHSTWTAERPADWKPTAHSPSSRSAPSTRVGLTLPTKWATDDGGWLTFEAPPLLLSGTRRRPHGSDGPA